MTIGVVGCSQKPPQERVVLYEGQIAGMGQAAGTRNAIRAVIKTQFDLGLRTVDEKYQGVDDSAAELTARLSSERIRLKMPGGPQTADVIRFYVQLNDAAEPDEGGRVYLEPCKPLADGSQDCSDSVEPYNKIAKIPAKYRELGDNQIFSIENGTTSVVTVG